MSENTAELKTEMDDDQTTAADAELETLDDDPEQATILSFNNVAVSDADGNTREGVHVTVETEDTEEPAAEKPEVPQGPSLPETNPIHEKAIAECEELGIDTRVIEFGRMLSVKTDQNGDPYVTDLRGLVRYYLEKDADRHLVVTDKYEEAAFIAEESTQRKNDLAEMMGAH